VWVCRLFELLSTGKDIPPQVLDVYRRANIEGSIPLLPGLWKSEMAKLALEMKPPKDDDEVRS
jgi:hypothetical protein